MRVSHTQWNPHPTTLRNVVMDFNRATATPPWTTTPNGPFWRIAYVKVFKWHRWAIYRNGVRMWAKRTLPEAMSYVRAHR